jgi:peptidoglycan/LPS O-acetylase OafA/YrhL
MAELLSSPPAEPSHLPGLNTLRAYAACAVIFSHINQNIENIAPLPLASALIKLFFINSQNAVSFFFVLSGFLITYLMLKEADLTGTVSVGKFYIRRAFRIWPLYYLVAIIGLLLFPLLFGSEYTSMVFNPDNQLAVSVPVKIILSFCLLPNFASLSAPMIHLWSIGVEEQFYLAWPWIFRRKWNLVLVCLGVIIIKLGLTPILYWLFGESRTMGIFNMMRFECMAVGALGAYCYYHRLFWLKIIYRPWVQLMAWMIFIFLLGRWIPVNAYTSMGISMCFIVIILNTATNARSLLKLNFPITERLGQISYGLYLYHFPVIFLCIKLMPRSIFPSGTLYSVLIFATILGMTWLVSELSYRWFEQPFLAFKSKFSAERR